MPWQLGRGKPQDPGLALRGRQARGELTPREREVMSLVVEGEANKVIAIDLGLSERTVEDSSRKVMEKMGAARSRIWSGCT